MDLISENHYQKIYRYYSIQWSKIEDLRNIKNAFEKTNKRTRTQCHQLASVSGLLFGILFPLTFIINEYVNYVLLSIFLTAHGLIFISFIFAEIIPLFLGARSLGIVRYGLDDNPKEMFNAINWQISSKEEKKLDFDRLILKINRGKTGISEFKEVIDDNKKLFNQLNFSLKNSRIIFFTGILLLGIVLIGYLSIENLIALSIICILFLISIVLYIILPKPKISSALISMYEAIKDISSVLDTLYKDTDKITKDYNNKFD